jgi:hypothetical protein
MVQGAKVETDYPVARGWHENLRGVQKFHDETYCFAYSYSMGLT